MPAESLPRSVPFASNTLLCCSACAVPTVSSVMKSFDVSESEIFNCACIGLETLTTRSSAKIVDSHFAFFICILRLFCTLTFWVPPVRRTICVRAVLRTSIEGRGTTPKGGRVNCLHELDCEELPARTGHRRPDRTHHLSGL